MHNTVVCLFLVKDAKILFAKILHFEIINKPYFLVIMFHGKGWHTNTLVCLFCQKCKKYSQKSKTTFWNNEILTDILAVVGLGIEVVIGLVGVEVEGLMLVLVVPGRVSTVILAKREKIIKHFLMKELYLPCPTRYYVHRPLPSSKIPYFQKKLGQVHNLSCENDFYLHENEKSFSCQRLST